MMILILRHRIMLHSAGQCTVIISGYHFRWMNKYCKPMRSDSRSMREIEQSIVGPDPSICSLPIREKAKLLIIIHEFRHGHGHQSDRWTKSGAWPNGLGLSQTSAISSKAHNLRLRAIVRKPHVSFCDRMVFCPRNEHWRSPGCIRAYRIRRVSGSCTVDIDLAMILHKLQTAALSPPVKQNHVPTRPSGMPRQSQ